MGTLRTRSQFVLNEDARDIILGIFAAVHDAQSLVESAEVLDETLYMGMPVTSTKVQLSYRNTEQLLSSIKDATSNLLFLLNESRNP